MFKFLLQKISSKKWLMLCLFIGNVLLIAILCCIRMYSDAIRQRTLSRKMNIYMEEHQEYPMRLTMNASLTVVSKKRHNGALVKEAATMAAQMSETTQIPYKEFVEHFNISAKAVPELARNNKKLNLSLQLGFLSNLEQHSEVVDGSFYQDEAHDGIISTVVSEKMIASSGLILGEILDITNIKDSTGKPIKVRIDGIFKNSKATDPYWVESPSSYDNMLFMSEELFKEIFVNFEQPTYAMRGRWYLLFDYHNLDVEHVKQLLEVTQVYSSFVQQQTAVTMEENYSEILNTFLLENDKTGATLWVLQAPILVLLIAFISMVSRQILSLEEAEIAIYKSRGISKFQILRIYTGQSLLIGLASCIMGVPLGGLICQLLGLSNAFLEFVGREALNINFFRLPILLDCCIAIFTSTIVTVIPVFTYADASIVGHRQRKESKHKMPFWQKFGLDFVLLLIACYGYYNFNGKVEELKAQVLAGGSIDPLLYFSSSLFMVGAGMVMVRVIHYLVRFLFRIGRRIWSPALYASFSRVIRTRNHQNFLIVFLILTIALGIFNAQTARTVNANDESNIRYRLAADIVLQEVWPDNSSVVEADSTNTISLTYQEPDFDKYLKLEGVISATKVYEGIASADGNNEVRLMGIDTKEFGETAWFPDNLLDSHWYNYLNAMATSPYGILVSDNFRAEAGYQLGDTLYYTVDGTQTWGIIKGFAQYWPGYEPTRKITYRDREFEVPNYLIIAHRSQLQTLMGVMPYKVYLKTTGETEKIFRYLLENGIELEEYKDATQILIDHKNDSVLQGTNGMLTVGFITVLLLCIIGFLIYWILSIKARTLQFGVFRAMGMSMKEIMVMLINEQFFITGFSVAAGVLTGLVASKMYIPLIQIAYLNEENILPMEVVSEGRDTYRILIVVAVMIVLCIFVLGNMIRRTKIAQALKLGEE